MKLSVEFSEIGVEIGGDAHTPLEGERLGDVSTTRLMSGVAAATAGALLPIPPIEACEEDHDGDDFF